MPEITRPHDSPTGYQLWHGAQGWDGAVDIRPCRKGSYEHGPGLYLTTSLKTAKHYGKGAGCLVEFELAPTTRWLEDAYLDVPTVIAFLKSRAGLRHRPAIIQDLNDNLARQQEREPSTTKVWAPVLVNLCVNHEALTADHGPALARFLVEQGIDASHANAKYAESWVVLFNPEVITRKVRHKVATVDVNADFPTIPEQQKRIEAQALTPDPSPARRRGPK